MAPDRISMSKVLAQSSIFGLKSASKEDNQSRRYPSQTTQSLGDQDSPRSPLKIAKDKPSMPVNIVDKSSISALEANASNNLQLRRYPTRRTCSAAEKSLPIVEQDVKPMNKKSRNIQVYNSSKRKFATENSPILPSNDEIISDKTRKFVHGAEFDGKNEADNEIFMPRDAKDMLYMYRKIHSRILQKELNIHGSHKKVRFDLLALKQFKEIVKCGPNKYLGGVPGVEVGQQFSSRVELSVIGLHRNLQAGIESIRYGETFVASNIISTRRCTNDSRDGSDILVYSGSGGNSGECDHKLEGGNLALKNSIDAKTPVRVIYGLKQDTSASKSRKSKNTMAYIYDGLYLVEKYWSEQGRKGSSVFRFQLRRFPNQARATIGESIPAKTVDIQTESRLTNESKVVDDTRVDISQGKEKYPIYAINAVTDELPKPFTYITKIIYPPWYKLIPYKGCNCVGKCSDSANCACAVRNGGEFPFNSEGCIVGARPLVYECGPSCRCSPSCQNRVSQHGIKFQLEVFMTNSRGWGVRSLSYIPSGSFICEYTGEMLQEVEAETRKNDEYLFDIGKNYNDESLWEGLPNPIPSMRKNKHKNKNKNSLKKMVEEEEEEGFTIDGAYFGNISRFINHNCTPNLYAQNVLYDHDDQCMPHIMLFASEDIVPFEELSYDYNYAIDRVQGPDGTTKKKDCYCGSSECTGRLY